MEIFVEYIFSTSYQRVCLVNLTFLTHVSINEDFRQEKVYSFLFTIVSCPIRLTNMLGRPVLHF